MKILKYQICAQINRGTEDEPKLEDVFSPVEMGWNETNEEIAKREAYNGEYTIEDDGTEQETGTTLESRVETLEADSADTKEALEMILAGVTE